MGLHRLHLHEQHSAAKSENCLSIEVLSWLDSTTASSLALNWQGCKRKKEMRAGTTAADSVYFKELSSAPTQNSSGFDSFIYEVGGNQNSCRSIIPSSIAEPFRLSANSLPPNLSPVFTSFSQEPCTWSPVCLQPQASLRVLAVSLASEQRAGSTGTVLLHSSWEVCFSTATSPPAASQREAAAVTEDRAIFRVTFPGWRKSVCQVFYAMHTYRWRAVSFWLVLLHSWVRCIQWTLSNYLSD